MVLVNGSEGIGTGWSTFVPNYNPRDIVTNIRHLLNDEMMDPMQPWYRGFRGSIEQTATKEGGVTYTVTGVIEQVNETTLRITELPVRRWTQDYKEFLFSMLIGNDKDKTNKGDKIKNINPFIERVMLGNLESELLKLDNKVRFILNVVEGKIIVNNRRRAELFLELKQKGFTPFPKKKTI